ncbi:hypothetical protein O181_000848 [Austropuccinia psidii MF-1]|uniref:Uncharacterized protein n=1 Tax=Austropuccinia psidii MF-1 TaxID=1389203 RepID=A0A9Q3B9B9_9BASI|nr:hypothetical protein [Austropuccinia psidii MF-1]
MLVNQGLVQIYTNPGTSSNKPTYPSATREQRILIKNETQALQKSGTRHKKMRNVSVLSMRAKKDNQNFFELPPMNLHSNTYILISATVPSQLPVIIYQVHCFNHPTLIFQNLKDMIISLNNLAHIRQKITTNNNLFAGIIRGIGFRQESEKGKSAGVYARKPVLIIKEIEYDNHEWDKLKKYDQFIQSRIQTLSKIAHEDNLSFMNGANHQFNSKMIQ